MTTSIYLLSIQEPIKGEVDHSMCTWPGLCDSEDGSFLKPGGKGGQCTVTVGIIAAGLTCP